jgi:hypothetical protein
MTLTPEQEALREKVARELAKNIEEEDLWKFYRRTADAAIAVVLKEAARVAKGYPDTYNDPVSAHAELMTCVRIGNAILSLIPQEGGK